MRYPYRPGKDKLEIGKLFTRAGDEIKDFHVWPNGSISILLEEELILLDKNGKFYLYYLNAKDLFVEREVKEVWINVYGESWEMVGVAHRTREDADKNTNIGRTGLYQIIHEENSEPIIKFIKL